MPFIREPKKSGAGSYSPINNPDGRDFLNRKRPFSDTLIRDFFNDTNGTALSAHTISPINKPATSWSAPGSFDIQSNEADHDLAFSRQRATLDPGVSNYYTHVIARMDGSGDASRNMGIIFRLLDASNYWFLRLTFGGVFQILEVNAGADVSRASASPGLTLGQNYKMELWANGTTITAKLDGGNTISYNSATFNLTETRAGIGGQPSTGPNVYDDFKVMAL